MDRWWWDGVGDRCRLKRLDGRAMAESCRWPAGSPAMPMRRLMMDRWGWDMSRRIGRFGGRRMAEWHSWRNPTSRFIAVLHSAFRQVGLWSWERGRLLLVDFTRHFAGHWRAASLAWEICLEEKCRAALRDSRQMGRWWLDTAIPRMGRRHFAGLRRAGWGGLGTCRAGNLPAVRW